MIVPLNIINNNAENNVYDTYNTDLSINQSQQKVFTVKRILINRKFTPRQPKLGKKINLKKILTDSKEFTTTFKLYDIIPNNGLKTHTFRYSSMKAVIKPKKQNLNNKSMTSTCTLSTNFSKTDTDSGKVKINKENKKPDNPQISKKFLKAQEKWKINYHATTIQKIFRGFYYRKNVFRKKRRNTIDSCMKIYSKKIMFDQNKIKKNSLRLNHFTDIKQTGVFSDNLSTMKIPKIKEIVINFNKK